MVSVSQGTKKMVLNNKINFEGNVLKYTMRCFKTYYEMLKGILQDVI